MEDLVTGLTYGILGENALLSDLLKLLEQPHSYLINLYGEHGAGKTKLLDALRFQSEYKDQMIYFDFNQDVSAEEIQVHLGKDKYLLLDDIDNRFSREQFKELLFHLFSQNSRIRILFTSKNKFFVESLPAINVYSFEVGSRNFDYNDFLSFMNLPDIAMRRDYQEFSEIILKNSYLFATYSRNFNFILFVLDKVSEVMKETKQAVSPARFIDILTNSDLLSRLNRDLVIDTRNVEHSEYLFMIRMKDKIEKLRDILLKYYPEESVLYEVMRNQFNPSFVETAFSLQIPYSDKLLNLCLSYDPVELLIRLLGPRDIILELNEYKIGEAVFTYSIEEKAKLILKIIGLNILDEPKSIEYFQDRYEKNYRLLVEDNHERLNKEYIIGLGISCYQEMENLFYEMLNFYANYFCGSMSGFFHLHNNDSQAGVHPKRITFGQYIGLFSYLNRLVKEDQYQLKMLGLGRREVVPGSLIQKIEELSSYRSFFSHYQRIQNYDIPYKTYRSKVMKLYKLVFSIMESFMEHNVFPEIIKIKSIIFDEFGRRLFVATDWKKAEIRFSLSSQSNIDIYSHYYILRKKQTISINPIVIPRYFDEKEELFSGEVYQDSSHTQQKQGAKLISYVTLDDGMEILDVGCGNGKTTIELFMTNPTVSIDAFDLSESMISTAQENRKAAGISEESIRFFALDALKLDKTNAYDLVFSNAALHWVTDSSTMFQKLYRALKNNGQLAVHLGGHNSYRGLNQMVQRAIEELDLQMYYQNWTYPIFYPRKTEMESLLISTGFKRVKVISVETDGSEFPNLVENFANAGMLPYLAMLPDEKLRTKLRNSYFKLCKSAGVDKYTHRLYAFAVKEEF